MVNAQIFLREGMVVGTALYVLFVFLVLCFRDLTLAQLPSVNIAQAKTSHLSRRHLNNLDIKTRKWLYYLFLQDNESIKQLQ